MKPEEVMPNPRRNVGWLSYSSMITHRECRQKWAYRYVLGLYAAPDSLDAKVELNFGIWWHALRSAEAIMRGRERGTLLWEPEELSTPDGAPPIKVADAGADLRSAVIDAARDWWSRISEDHAEAWHQRLGEGVVERLEALDVRWHDRYDADLEYEDPLVVEGRWSRELPGTGKNIIGYVDEVYRDRRRNIVVALDRKTSKDLESRTAEDDMMDSQLHLYVWGLTPKLREYGVQVNAVSYDRARSVKPTTPRLTQAGALSKQVTQFDLRTYREWVAQGQEYPGRAKDGSGAGVYQEDPAVIEHLSSPAWQSRWFQRTRVPLNRNLTRAHLQAAVDTSKDIDVTVEKFNRRGEAPRSLATANCRWCDYRHLCRAQMMGGPDGEYPLGDFGLVKA